MTGRRTFLKSLVGAFVASAVEIRLIAEPIKDELFGVREVMMSLQETVRAVWEDRFRREFQRMSFDQ